MVKKNFYDSKSMKQIKPVVTEVSAGGVVIKKFEDEWLVAVIATLNKQNQLAWCLPKGHVEEGETIQEAALREVLEETGIVGKIITPINNIDYWFSNKTNRIHKTVHHYLIEFIDGDITTGNDPDSKIVAVNWFPLKNLSKKLAFATEREIARIVEAKMVSQKL